MPDYSRLLASASCPYPAPLTSDSYPILVFHQAHPVKRNETINKKRKLVEKNRNKDEKRNENEEKSSVLRKQCVTNFWFVLYMYMYMYM